MASHNIQNTTQCLERNLRRWLYLFEILQLHLTRIMLYETRLCASIL
jgi:hypothetical protein